MVLNEGWNSSASDEKDRPEYAVGLEFLKTSGN
jgi:hypothetical protein